jgi:hypothetical protein
LTLPTPNQHCSGGFSWGNQAQNKNKDIQLQYVELLVKKLIKELNENQDFDFSELREDEEKYIKNYLLLHIRLLCAQKETNKILFF